MMPSFKPPDVLLYEWQIWLLKLLRKQGYKITLKPHPKSIESSGIHLLPYCDGIIEGQFDPVVHQADCLIFDFVGTAMMDALASHSPVVYLDHGIRQFDSIGKEWLDERVNIVPCHFDKENRIRAIPSDLCEAIESAAEHDWHIEALHFVERYF